MRVWILRSAAVAVAIVMTVLLIGASEFGSYQVLTWKGVVREAFGDRFHVDPNTEYVPYIAYRYKPLRKEVRPGLETDRHGFIHNGDRTRDLTRKQPNVYRIFLVGGSTVAGNTAPADTLSAVLETYLNRALADRGLRFEVVNTGVSAWLSAQELGLITYYLGDYQPDLIVSFDGFNDVYQEIRAPREGWRQNTSGHLLEQAQAAWTHTYSIGGTFRQAFGMLADRSYTVALLDRVAAMATSRLPGPVETAQPVPGLFPNPLTYYKRNVELMIAASRALGAAHVAVLQPTLLLSNSEGRSYRAPYIQESRSSWERVDFWGEKETLWKRAEGIFEDLNARHDNGRTVVVRSFSHVLDDEAEPSYIDQAHYTAAANTVIAKRLGLELVRTVLADASVARSAARRDSE
jgi:hypothetical protein